MTRKPARTETRVSIIQSVQTPLGFFVLLVLIVEAAAGAFAATSPKPDRTYIVLGMVGLMVLLVVIVSFFAYHRPEALAGIRPTGQNVGSTGILDPSSHDIKITEPSEPGRKGSAIDLHGTFKKAPPEGYTLQIFRVYPNARFTPLRQARIDPKRRKWDALSCDPGGKTGDKRELAVYMVGPGGKVLIDYYSRASQVFYQVRERLIKISSSEDVAWLPAMEIGTPDMVECDRILVEKA